MNKPEYTKWADGYICNHPQHKALSTRWRCGTRYGYHVATVEAGYPVHCALHCALWGKACTHGAQCSPAFLAGAVVL